MAIEVQRFVHDGCDHDHERKNRHVSPRMSEETHPTHRCRDLATARPTADDMPRTTRPRGAVGAVQLAFRMKLLRVVPSLRVRSKVPFLVWLS